MSIFDFLRGEFIDVIHWTDDTRDTIVWRFEREGHAIKYGAKLTVREGQAAVFVHEGQLADVFGPGLYELETNNLPILTTLQHWDHGFQSPFKSEIYFVNTRRFTDLKWGTRNPITCRDPEFGMVRLRAFGTYTMRVADPGKFLIEIVGTDGEFTTEEIEFQIRNIIVTHFSQIIASSGIPVLDMAANTIDLAKIVHERIAPMIAEYGLELPAFYIENISLPGRGRGGARQAHRDRRRRRPLEVHRVQRRRGDDQVRRQPRRRRRHGRRHRHGHGHGDGRAHGAHAAPGARPPRRGADRRRRAAAAAGARSAGTSASDGQGDRPLHPRRARAAWSSDGTVDRRQLALDAGRAGLAARPRRRRARRPLQRAAAAAARRLTRGWSSARLAGSRVGGGASLSLPDLRRGPALRARARRAEVRRTAATRRRSPSARGRDPRARPARGRARRAAAAGDARRLRVAQCPSCGAQIEFDADDARPECPFCASPIVTDTGVAAADQAAGAAALPARARTQARDGDEPLARPAVVRAVRPQGICPRRAGDAGHLRPLLDLRRRDPQPTTPASAAPSTTRPGR